MTPSQPILFPKFDEDPKGTDEADLPKGDTSVHIGKISLDALQDLKTNLPNNNPEISLWEHFTKPSIWTIVICGLVIIIGDIIIYRKTVPKCRKTGSPEEVQLPLTEVQSPTRGQIANIPIPR
ncbi:hypothetical protein TcasGA2_TC010219 [Tribolium castaneum]|uniref:Uncharacterized protein n=1 Tax=Tribolium castaneum TaxID=7070 RepID=D6WTP8_TRICA|nr:hypothetical protein TcasGA2_TC010219 [Tribolium castaneum]